MLSQPPKARSNPPPRTPKEEFVYQLAMAKWMHELGYYALAESHLIAVREAQDGIVRF